MGLGRGSAGLPVEADDVHTRLAHSLAAAHCAQPGDLVIICAYGVCDEAEAAKFKPTLVYVDRENRLTHTNHSIPAQAA